MEANLRVEQYDSVFDFLVADNGTAVDISGATTKKLHFKRPDGSTLSFTASFKTDGTDGYLRWTITQGQIRKEDRGEWRVQAELIGVTQFSGRTDPAAFYVHGNLG